MLQIYDEMKKDVKHIVEKGRVHEKSKREC
jgi:hypothetical protein